MIVCYFIINTLFINLKNKKMNNFKKFFDYFFLIFLIVYLILMLGHLKEINFGIWTSLIFLAGLTLAVFAHAKRNYITVILLVVHMSIE